MGVLFVNASRAIRVADMREKPTNTRNRHQSQINDHWPCNQL